MHISPTLTPGTTARMIVPVTWVTRPLISNSCAPSAASRSWWVILLNCDSVIAMGLRPKKVLPTAGVRKKALKMAAMGHPEALSGAYPPAPPQSRRWGVGLPQAI